MSLGRTIEDWEEYPHDYPPRIDWKESWYFTYMDGKSKVCGVFYYPLIPTMGEQTSSQHMWLMEKLTVI